jgi:hypothetical protein
MELYVHGEHVGESSTVVLESAWLGDNADAQHLFKVLSCQTASTRDESQRSDLKFLAGVWCSADSIATTRRLCKSYVAQAWW